MKKQYITPTLLVQELGVENDIVYASPLVTDENAEQDFGMDTKEEKNVWDEVWNRNYETGKQ